MRVLGLMVAYFEIVQFHFSPLQHRILLSWDRSEDQVVPSLVAQESGSMEVLP